MKITKAQFESLLSDTITKEEYDRIISLIINRCDEIITKMIFPRKVGFGGWSFDNRGHESPGCESDDNGFFDPQKYKEFVSIDPEPLGWRCCVIPEPYRGRYRYIAKFPTRWLWEENWEEEFNKEVSLYKAQKEKTKKDLRASALAKLTPEERRVLGL